MYNYILTSHISEVQLDNLDILDNYGITIDPKNRHDFAINRCLPTSLPIYMLLAHSDKWLDTKMFLEKGSIIIDTLMVKSTVIYNNSKIYGKLGV